MKLTLIFTSGLALALSVFTSCDQAAPAADDSVEMTKLTPAVDMSQYPADFAEVLDAHGGLANWKTKRQLSYVMPKGDRQETQLVDLHDRRERISQPVKDSDKTVLMGFDGQRTWVLADSSYGGDPVFYRNLMFYFYAMPWVLADPGIQYTAVEPLTFDGVSYPGIMVGYDDGIGLSPKDNYRLHYDPKTKAMRWLGYTVTGRSGEVSDRFSWIEYPTWSAYDGVQLPDSLVWYTTEENLPIKPRNTQVFSEVKISEKEADAARFAVPAGAKVVAGE